MNDFCCNRARWIWWVVAWFSLGCASSGQNGNADASTGSDDQDIYTDSDNNSNSDADSDTDGDSDSEEEHHEELIEIDQSLAKVMVLQDISSSMVLDPSTDPPTPVEKWNQAKAAISKLVQKFGKRVRGNEDGVGSYSENSES